MKLRPYQETMVSEIRKALAGYRRVIVQLPTGGGKTALASEVARLAVARGRKVLIVSNRTEIFSQNGGSFERAGMEVSYISPRQRNIPDNTVCCAMAQTLKRRVEKEEWVRWVKTFDFVFIDEAHTCDADFIFGYLEEKCYVIGLTATPSRGGHQRQLGDMYKAMVTGVTVKELISSGFLTPARHFSVAAPKLEGVEFNSSSGDYSGTGLARCFEKKKLYTGLVQEWLRLAEGRKTLIFCVSARQAIDLTKEFNLFDVKARYLLSGSFDDDSDYSGSRSDTLEAFRRGEFDVLVNVGIAIAGLDIPEINCVVLNYATVSITKYLQSIGRASRVASGKDDFIILDCGENYRRLGRYDDDREWSLWHYEGQSNGQMTYKLCDASEKNAEGVFGCGQMVPSPCKVCPACGRKFITSQDEFQMHLEEITESSDSGSIVRFCAEKKLEGWNLNRIMIQICLSNQESPRTAFKEAYMALYPEKTSVDAERYWHVFNERFWKKIKGRKK